MVMGALADGITLRELGAFLTSEAFAAGFLPSADDASAASPGGVSFDPKKRFNKLMEGTVGLRSLGQEPAAMQIALAQPIIAPAKRYQAKGYALDRKRGAQILAALR
jgi:hypothetical protein